MKSNKFEALLNFFNGKGKMNSNKDAVAKPKVDLSDKAKVRDIMSTINKTCREKGGKYATYSCKTVSWDDVSRGTVGGSLSCWGSNITDTYLKSKSGEQLFTVRSDNWNEKLGVITSSDIALVQGNQSNSGKLSPITLKTFLKNSKQYGGYTGLSTEDLSDDVLDQRCSIRFQTTFLPVTSSNNRGTIEFSTEAYNYNTRSDADPRNLVLLCTTQGIALQQDGRGTKKLFHHAVDQNKTVHRYWLEAERTRHKVGGAQVEEKEEKQDAIKRGKATASVIGTKAMGTRFNVLMTIQIPLKQEKARVRSYPLAPPVMLGCSFPASCSIDLLSASNDELAYSATKFSKSLSVTKGFGGGWKGFQTNEKRKKKRCEAKKKAGTANAARVSRGSKVDTWEGLTKKTPTRNPEEHITITVVFYFTVAGGVPSEADVMAAIDDMEALYMSCEENGRLAEEKFDFMKSELTVKDVKDINEKLMTQPPFQSASVEVHNFDQFPQ